MRDVALSSTDKVYLCDINGENFEGILLCLDGNFPVGQIIYDGGSWCFCDTIYTAGSNIYSNTLSNLVNDLIQDEAITSLKVIDYKEKLSL